MRGISLGAAILALLGLGACSDDPVIEEPREELPREELPVEIFSYRQSAITAFTGRIEADESSYQQCAPDAAPCDCPPGAEDCGGYRGFGGGVVFRGSQPFMAEITAPADYSTPERGAIAAGDWGERHYCGGTLVAPGWVLTAAHCVDAENMTRPENPFRIRVGMTNLAAEEGRTFPMIRIVCFEPTYCHSSQRPRIPDPNDSSRTIPVALYANDIALIQFAYEPGDLVEVEPTDGRAEVGITSAQLSDDGNVLTTRSNDGTERRWDARSGAELTREIQGRAAQVIGPGVSGRIVATVPRADVQGARRTLAFDNGRRRVSWRTIDAADGGAPTTRVSLDRSEQATSVGLPGSVESLLVSPDHRYIVALNGDRQDVQFTGLRADSLGRAWTRTPSMTLEPSDYDGFRPAPQLIEVDRYGALLSEGDAVLAVDPASGSVLRRFDHPRTQSAGVRNLVAGAVVSPDDRMLTFTRRYAGSDLWLWDVASGRMLHRFVPHFDRDSEFVEGAVFLPGEERVLSWSQYGTLQTWNAETGTRLKEMHQQLAVSAVQVFANGSRALVSDEAGASVWNLATGEEVARMDHQDTMIAAVLSPDEALVLSYSDDGTARVWDATTGEEKQRIYHSGNINGARFVEGQDKVLSWSADGTARITDAVDGSSLMAFDVLAYPIGSTLAPPLADRPPQPARVQYKSFATSAYAPDVGAEVRAYGWGTTIPVEGIQPYASLMEFKMRSLGNEDCAARDGMGPITDDATGTTFVRVHPGVFCASDQEQTTCKGDSGGPVIQNRELVGIVSWGKKHCSGSGEPVVFTRVAIFAEWIEQIISGQDPPPTAEGEET